MRIGIGCDNNGFLMKEELKSYIEKLGYTIKDYGCYSLEDTDYPDISFAVCEGILSSEVERAILICGTGIGMAIAANKIPGIRAAQVHDVYSAERAQLSNNAQIITFGAKVIGIETAKKLTREYLNNTFVDGRSGKKLKKITEKEYQLYGSNNNGY